MTTLDISLQLERLVDEIGALQSKLVLLIGAPHSGKTALLRSLAKNKGVKPLNIGALLGARLAGSERAVAETSAILNSCGMTGQRCIIDPLCVVLVLGVDLCLDR